MAKVWHSERGKGRVVSRRSVSGARSTGCTGLVVAQLSSFFFFFFGCRASKLPRHVHIRRDSRLASGRFTCTDSQFTHAFVTRQFAYNIVGLDQSRFVSRFFKRYYDRLGASHNKCHGDRAAFHMCAFPTTSFPWTTLSIQI